MRIRRTGNWFLLAIAIWAMAGSTASAQERETLARAKDYYASAAYEEALQVIERLRTQAPAADTSEVGAYQVFCLVALGRTDQAKQAVEAMVRFDPLYHPSETLASPRVRTLYEETRRPLLPQLARQSYTKARNAFDRKDLPAALVEFDRAIAILDELADSDDPGLVDLRTLAAGFRDLCKTAPAKPAPAPASAPTESADPPHAAPPPKPDPPAPATAFVDAPTGPKAASEMPDRDMIYGPGDASVKPPVAVSRDMPTWSPANTFEARAVSTGILEVIVSESGTVSSVTMRKSALPSYDAALLRAAANWKFKPATKNGVAVKYRLDVSIQLGR